MKEMDETQGLDWLGEDEISRRRLHQRKRYDRLTPTQRAGKIQKTMQNRKRKRNAHYTSPNINLGREFSDGQTQKPSPNPPLEDNLMEPETNGQRLGEAHLSQPHELRSMANCRFCQAKRFQNEPPTFCCHNGEVVLTSPSVPSNLRNLFTTQTVEALEFRKHIRAYNSIFGFTSFGVTLDKGLANSTGGVYTFRAQGQIYHELPSLIPSATSPCYFQLYFYDTDNELQNRLDIMERKLDPKKKPPLNPHIVRTLMDMLSANPYAMFLRRLDQSSLDSYRIHIRTDVKLDQRVYNSPSADQVAAIWIEGNNATVSHERDIIVHSNSGHKHRVQHYYGCYDPLQYPLLFPRGEFGWHQNILRRIQGRTSNRASAMQNDPSFQSFQSAEDIFRREQDGVVGSDTKKVSCREYYCYKLQIRDDDPSVLLLSGRLLQQYVVDMYIKLENTRLDYFRQKQSDIRAELYQGIVDSVLAGESRGSMVGKRVVLPGSFVGGPRDMRRRYLDAIALVQRFGKPDLFITMTCNPDWKEIKDSLKQGQLAQDRPDLTARVFRAKLKDLKDQLFKKCIFGKVAAHIHVIEFQKRGLPHAHMLIILKSDCKITNSDKFDQFVCAEIPNPNQFPDLYEKVAKHMMHGPCGVFNKKNPCMRGGKCKNRYPRSFAEETVQGEDSYPIYRRRKDSFTVNKRGTIMDNRWVVPYNPYLLSRYNCHLNVEICSGVKAVKYLYKYIYKGHDKIVVDINHNEGDVIIDEIKQFQDARWVSAQEAMWRIFEFDLYDMYPAVINLPLHLPNKQTVPYGGNQDLENVLNSDTASRTMLTEFFNFCLHDKEKTTYLYREFPEHFVWNRKGRYWSERKTRAVIGRINSANPVEGERYYLRVLLNHVRRPTSYADLLTVNGVKCSSFKEAAEKRGLLQTDNWLSECLADAASFQMPQALRNLFAVILVYCDPSDVRKLWQDYYEPMSEDFLRLEGVNEELRLLKTLKSIDMFLESIGKSIKDYDLPAIKSQIVEIGIVEKREVLDELAVKNPPEDCMAPAILNPEQKYAYNIILDHVDNNRNGSFFIDGPGGSGKTYLYRALLATIRSNGMIALATATSGVAASILPGGRTAHSRFKIPIDGNDSSVCNIPKQSGTAELIRRAKLIIWDEAPMAKRWAIEALDRSLKDIMSNNSLFGGKVIVFGGDFRQVLPVVPRGTRAETVQASLAKSYLWTEMQKLILKTNMRAQSDSAFSDFLLRVGNGVEPTVDENMIQIPEEMIVRYEGRSCESCLINAVFPSLKENANSAEYITHRAILATRNESVDMLNDKLIATFPGEEWKYVSYDEAIDDTHCYYPEEFLNTLTPNGLPPHELVLKVNSPIMLLRNLNPSVGLCNGTRMVCKGFERNVIHAEITLGQHAGKQVLLNRIPLFPAENDSYPFQFKRTQFPIRLCFAMTINKAQGQTIPNVGVYLPQPVFSHGQLYVALSRGISMSTTKVLINTESKRQRKKNYAKNIVYKEVLTS
ncbi:hypothetical protein RHGRI_000157 [Rhododendron griersonianum]|uniref:ATP-dependent DNA helicase n=2 Tax=Rhododendron griersonianum TaxID=479676 RepID=A0AAV6LIQ1_9ERIC|nr:hypothetical protein RHGRI_000157 [Rhododendron griersonianum]